MSWITTENGRHGSSLDLWPGYFDERLGGSIQKDEFSEEFLLESHVSALPHQVDILTAITGPLAGLL